MPKTEEVRKEQVPEISVEILGKSLAKHARTGAITVGSIQPNPTRQINIMTYRHTMLRPDTLKYASWQAASMVSMSHEH
jgi:hypothetical protein